MKFLNLVHLHSGSTIDGKVIADSSHLSLKADVTDLDAHTNSTSNPHGVTKSQVGLENVENKSSATIRGEITSANVTTALGYTPEVSFAKNDAFNKNFGTAAGTVAEGNHTHSFSSLTSKPTTISGYGITDTYTKTNLQTSGQSSLHWDNLTNVPASFTPSAHNHDDLYVKLIGSTMSGPLKIDNSSGGILLGLYSTNSDSILKMGHSEASGYSYEWKYTGTETGNNNSLELWTEGTGASGVDTRVFRIQQDGILQIDQDNATIAGNIIYHAGNLPDYEPANTNIQAHISNTSNPHGVTKAQVGLGSVENKSSATIRGELTNSNVTTALGFTPSANTHTHDTRYYTQTTLQGDGTASVHWNNLTNVPTDFTPSDHTHSDSEITGLGTASTKDVGISAGQVPLLDSAGKLNTSVLPALSITDTFVVASETAMLGLTAQRGDIAIRTDLNQSFVLAADDPTVVSSWQEMLTPTDTVLSVNGKTGAVTLDYSDVGAAASSHSHAISHVTGLQTALDGKENAFTKNTAFNKNFGTTSGTVAEGNHDHTSLANGAVTFGSTTGGGGYIHINPNANNSDPQWIATKVVGNNSTAMYINVGDDNTNTDYVAITTTVGESGGVDTDFSNISERITLGGDGVINAIGGYQWNGQSLDNRYLGKTANAVSASKWANPRTITLTGDASGSVAIDGSGNVSMAVSVNNAFAPPSAVTNLTLTEIDDEVDVTFTLPTDGLATHYEIWSSVGSDTDFGLIGIIEEDDLDPTATTATIMDNTYTRKTTVYYRVYAINNTAKSLPTENSIVLTQDVPDPINMVVTPELDTFIIQYDPPNDRRLETIQIYRHAHDSSASLSEASATLVYAGEADNFIYKIPDTDLEKYHQFWISSVTRS